MREEDDVEDGPQTAVVDLSQIQAELRRRNALLAQGESALESARQTMADVDAAIEGADSD